MDFTPGAAVAAQFRQACAEFNFKHRPKFPSLIVVLDHTAQSLAQSDVVRTDAGADPRLWADLRKLWRDLTRMQLSFWDNDDSDEDDDQHRGNQQQNGLRAVCMSLAKFTRNLVAGVPDNQLRAYENEPDMRHLLHFYTSWSAMEDNESVATARLLTQALSNTVTANDALVARLWETYMNLPEDQVVLIRLLGSPDPRTLLTTLIFILNCIHGSKKRALLLTRTKVGVRICIGLLDNMVGLHEAEEGSDGAKAFDVGYAIFTQFIENGMVPDLYKKFTIPNEIVTPHQTTLLKLLDSYLQSTQLNTTSIHLPEILKTHENLGSFLAKRFFMLSDYAQQAMRRSLGVSPVHQNGETTSEDATLERPSSESLSSGKSAESLSSSSSALTPFPQELDVMLPKVCEALVLITQCIVTISLGAEEQQTRLDESISTIVSFTNMKQYFILKKSSDVGVIESLIELLRLLDAFLPRINFGKPVNRDGTPGSSSQPGIGDGSGFSYLKRDLVRLLGVLSHGEKAIQDRTREAGGLPVVMNLCVVDERNPYLREHAIFTLHSLLKDNQENQEFVNSIKPSQEWDEDGTLKTRVGATILR
ncbi:spinocerebellar ataxia type 10 protein domain-containing protein [Gymnopilus junonius]|uniref:Ataxin-10 homolog n=1 Tax=Gymnopilus junonius TaxID=109634 RepID=A0A9P5TSQ3_GYMJU|nr:spinocerebellar ataxia type 10 protein domain-containing protein [Gymnopilus junonius]